MKLHRIVIGIQLNKKIFRLSSLSGLLIDEMLVLRDSEKTISDKHFTRVSSSHNTEDVHVSLRNEDRSHEFLIQAAHVGLSIRSVDGETINLDKAYKEFELLWKRADKTIKFPAIRAIGIVAEYRIDADTNDSASNQLMDALLKNKRKNQAGRFQLQFQDITLKEDGKVPDVRVDDFWSTTFSLYSSDRDESPEDGKINANIEVQKLYAPAKSGPIAELRKVKERFLVEKKKFKQSLVDMGLE
jgi:hypothetical protein